MESIMSMGKLFRELADICDELATLEEKEKNGEDIKQQSENVTGRFFMKIMELEQLKGSM